MPALSRLGRFRFLAGFVAGLAAASLAAGLIVVERNSSSPKPLPDRRAVDRESLPPPVGPLAGAHWPAGSVQSGMLLFDDGRRLWNVPLDGPRHLIWAHQKFHLYELSAAPDGKSLAYSVSLKPKTGADLSAVLYLLRADGSVQTVDSQRHFGSIESPIFLSASTDPSGPVRLYWIRSYDENFEPGTAHLKEHVMTLGDGELRRIRLALRPNEAPVRISGYAGSPLLSMFLFRRNNQPTRFELMRGYFPRASPNYWFESIANTELPGAAWISPREYVVQVGQRSFPRRNSLRLYRVTCEFFGSHLVTRGRAIDWGSAELPWPLLPAGPKTVLVLGSKALNDIYAHKARTAPWLALNVRTGELRRTSALWRQGEGGSGWWTFVQSRSKEGIPESSQDANCSKYSWTYG